MEALNGFRVAKHRQEYPIREMEERRVGIDSRLEGVPYGSPVWQVIDCVADHLIEPKLLSVRTEECPRKI